MEKIYKDIERVVKEKGLQNDIIINIQALYEIMGIVGCNLYDVMYYFRFIR